MNKKLIKSIYDMTQNIVEILWDNVLSIYVYGSYVLNDFKFGWSDIDILVLTKDKINESCAERLLNLRQEMMLKEPDNLYYRSFEGAMLSLEGFLNNSNEKVVYWGTKGQKIKDNYKLDSFSMKELAENSILVFGEDVRDKFKLPIYNNLIYDVKKHYETIREHAIKTDRNLYSFGWFLDISRCIYTLKTGEIISKTKAGKWALKNNLCPDKKALKMSLKVRENPKKLKINNKIMNYAESLGDSVQKYADVLEQHLKGIK